MSRAAPHIDWILSTGRTLGLQGLVDALGPRLIADGIPLMRIRLGMRTTHPLTAAFSVVWEAAGAKDALLTFDHGARLRADYAGSPIERINTTRQPFRRKLLDPLTDDDHETLHEIRNKGGTDYYGLSLDFALGSNAIAIFVSDGPTGFSQAHITLLNQLAAVLAPVAEVYAQHHLADAIATSYLGQRTGQRVLAGQITRGDIETAEAAILFSDIRGWTALNATRPAIETLAIANSYFEVISDAVDNNDGEILKFMGDGVLALFPGDGTVAGAQDACRKAISAAHAAKGIAALAELAVPFGIGIHYGEVLYGNIGARARIDFTVLGQAVNIAARVESCTGRLNHTLLVSQTVADIAGVPMHLVSTETLKGVDDPMPLFIAEPH
jgi:adenylate cyclase